MSLRNLSRSSSSTALMIAGDVTHTREGPMATWSSSYAACGITSSGLRTKVARYEAPGARAGGITRAGVRTIEPWLGMAALRFAAREALAMALDHALGEALGREAPRELGTLKLDRGNDGARHRLAIARIRELEYAPVDLRGLQFLPRIGLEVAADLGLAHAQRRSDGARRALRLAHHGAVRHDEVAIQRKLGV